MSVTLAVVLLAACDGGDPSRASTGGYVSSVCTAVGKWLDYVKPGLGEARQALSRTESPGEGKRLIVHFLGSISRATMHLLEDLGGAGAPRVPGGRRIASALLDAVGAAGRALTPLRASALELPTGSHEAFIAAARGLVRRAQAVLSAAAGPLKALRSAALAGETRSDTACRRIGV